MEKYGHFSRAKFSMSSQCAAPEGLCYSWGWLRVPGRGDDTWGCLGAALCLCSQLRAALGALWQAAPSPGPAPCTASHKAVCFRKSDGRFGHFFLKSIPCFTQNPHGYLQSGLWKCIGNSSRGGQNNFVKDCRYNCCRRNDQREDKPVPSGHPGD